MESQQTEPSSSPPASTPDIQHPTSTRQEATTSVRDTPSLLSSWAKSFKISQPSGQEESQPGNTGKSTFARFTSGLGISLSPKSNVADGSVDDNLATSQSGVLGSITKGFMDSSRSAVKAVQVKARHIVSQNKRRYQEGGFDLDMTYITENIIAMGFPAGDMSSGFFGYVEGFYRNHMEEVIRFFETHHKGKYKVYNLCSERLYDASLFEGKVACFPFDDHNCPPIQLITLFCQSAYSWLKEDIENVVVVHCKAGMARTGLMISSLLLYLKFFPTAEESIDYYNQKRCVDGKGLVLPSQIRYVKYFERVLTYFNGENQPGRRCMLRGFRLHRCPYWIRPSITISSHNGVLFSTKVHPRTKDLMPEDFWFSAPKKGIMVFALPGVLSCPHRLPCPLRTNPLRLFPLRRKAVHMTHMTAAETAGAASARDLSGYPKPLSPPYPPLSKEIELSRAESAEARSAAFTLSESEIVFEDEWMVVVNKPSGVYCETILSSLKPPQIEGIGHITIPSELHMANRLDRDTSGLMIITKSHKAAAKLVKAFTDHKVKKTYLALCIGHVPNWNRISISSGHGRSKFGAWRVYSASDVDRKLPGGSHVKHMATSFEVLSVNGRGELRQPMVLDMDPVESVVVQDERSIDGGEELDEVLIRAYPQSGRSHQIRLHCQYLGVPIRGDVKYGGVHQWKGVSCDAHALHSESLSFEHPITGLPIRFHAPLPIWVSERYETALEEF